ncbi:MAG: adenylosuccinate lyase [Candidatus Pacebacteria bacterium]|jgi:adenylosuccinate lyase|nr:adenylosuccinate lyase [Candidatus Paceibacterota bacterium]
MIHPIDNRYGSPEMRAIFDEEKRLEYQLRVEAALVESLAELGQVPAAAAKIIKEKATPEFVKLERVKEIEEITRHDVMALVKALTEVSGEAGKYVHLTATSYDIVDTAQALQIKEAINVILAKGKILLGNCLDIAQKYKDTVQVGRTHGQHAIPITFGFKFANFADKIGEDLVRLKEDLRYAAGKFSGAVGNYAAQEIYGLGDELELRIMGKLGINAADISTQVAPRENLARIVCDIAILAATVEQVAKEVRNLQRTEIAEASEPFGKSQVGSSTMAQKRNPINSENICGNVRVIRSCVAPVLEDVALEHERDLTNSACERSILPTAFVLLDDVLTRINKILAGLVVIPENMAKNLALTRGTIMAEAMITRLVQKGMGRQDAHEILRQSSFEALAKNIELKEVLRNSEAAAKYLSKEEIEKHISYNSYIGRSAEKTDQIITKWQTWNL